MHPTILVSLVLLSISCIAISQGKVSNDKHFLDDMFNKRNLRSRLRQKQQLRGLAAENNFADEQKDPEEIVQPFPTKRIFEETEAFNEEDQTEREIERLQFIDDLLRRDENGGISFTRPIETATCGRQQREPELTQRIIGGTEAVPHAWPWQILFEGEGTCGGTIITAEYILTAAHCIGSEAPESITITAGLHNTKLSHEEEKGRQVRQVEKVFVHPNYDGETIKNDITILKLSQPLTFTKYVQPACLPGPDPKPDSEVVLLGWGLVKTAGELSPVLKQTVVHVVGDCHKHWEGNDDATQLCVKDHTLTSASCQGDSGGPALQEHGGQWVVEGVTSFGHSTCEVVAHGLPDVYTRVSAFLPWIHSIIGPSQ